MWTSQGLLGRRAAIPILLTVMTGGTPLTASALSGHLLLVGQGPEQPVLQELARLFERRNPGTAIDLEWDKNLRAVELVQAGKAQIAVTGQPAAPLRATQVAWDGIAVVVNFANPVREVNASQIRALLSGDILRWSELDGADRKVEIVSRPVDLNLNAGLEQSLGLPGLLKGGKAVRSDSSALREVSGRDAAVTYLSLNAALKAQEDGVPIQILTVDQVEPGEPTVTSGRYGLRRPVLFLTAPQPDPLTEAFLTFARSPEGQQILRSMFAPLASPAETPRAADAKPSPGAADKPL